jgi:hypothetical protein
MAHTAPAAAFVLHHTKIGKGAVKKLEIYSHWRSKLFLIVIFHLSLGRAAMMILPRISAPLYLMNAVRLKPLSAGSISMDSNFKKEL